jgi:hypothetical protein
LVQRQQQGCLSRSHSMSCCSIDPEASSGCWPEYADDSTDVEDGASCCPVGDGGEEAIQHAASGEGVA